MKRRVSKAVVAALFALVLSLSAPSAFAAQRDGGWGGPDFGTRIVRVLKNWMRHFGIGVQEDINWPSPPKP